MDRYTETYETWNKAASLYAEKFMELNVYNETYDFIINSLTNKNASILEIGCGPGNITKYLLSKRPNYTIFGIDIAPNMITLAQQNNPTAKFAVMDSREISQLNIKYDAIICGFCLPYLSPTDSQKFIFDCNHLLHPNGLLYISFVEGDPAKSDFQVGSHGNRVYFYFHNLTELQKQLENNDFEEVKVFKVSYPKNEKESEMHTVIVAKKK
ncbi:MAG: class I SAM-dependent methyltransferase, partial [Flavobacterium sp.]